MLDPLLAPLAADPGASAVVLDVDGTLAPIAPHPDAAAVPAASLALVVRLVDRFALVGCVSGRTPTEVARLVPVPGVRIAGNHGLELLDGGAAVPAAGLESWLPTLAQAASALAPIAAAAGAWVEDKGATLAVHLREAPDPERARAALEAEAVPLLGELGLRCRWGRMVLEARPPLDVDKGTAVAALVARVPAVRRVLYAGDDATDLDAFAVADVAVAVRSPEAPPGLLDAAAIVVDGPDGLARLLAELVGGQAVSVAKGV